jgi:tryptophan synthase alpha chain
LAAGTRVEDALECAASIHESCGIGVIFMTYLNPVLAYGWEKFARRSKEAGALGILLTDVPADESAPFLDLAKDLDLAMVFLVAPTSSAERIRLVCSVTTGFVYCVSRLGITGERDSLSTAFQPVLQTIRSVSDLPVGLGFGISTPEHARQAGEVADAVIVGSAFVRIVEEAGSMEEGAQQLESMVRAMRRSLGGKD